MGKMNLLKASIEGKIGEMYGTQTRGQAILHAVPFSHAPHSETQTKSVRAFEKVNRIAGGMAKYFWAYLHLSDKKMLRHNAVAQWLKPLLVEHQFVLSNIVSLVPDRGTASIEAATVNRETGAFALEVSFTALDPLPANTQGAVLLVDENGKVIYGSSFTGASFAHTGLARLNSSLSYYALLFRSDYTGTHWQPNSFKLLQANVQN